MKTTRMVAAACVWSITGVLLGCGQATVDPVIDVAPDDAEIRAVEQEARDRLGEFVKALDHPTLSQSGFAVEARFTDDNDDVEYMWLNNLSYSQGRFTGELNNEPYAVKGFSLGDQPSVGRDEVVDWLYLDNDTMKGGFSAKILAERRRDSGEG